MLVGRGDRAKELEILVLRDELSILRRQAGQPRFEAHDRVLLAAFSRMLPRRSWNAFLVQPETLLHWHRRLVARWTTPSPREGEALLTQSDLSTAPVDRAAPASATRRLRHVSASLSVPLPVTGLRIHVARRSPSEAPDVVRAKDA